MKKIFETKKSIMNEEKKSNEITLIYDYIPNRKYLNIFGSDFVKNNRNKLKIIHQGTEYKLKRRFDLKNIKIHNNKLEIKLIGIDKITNMGHMFHDCISLIVFQMIII